MTTKKIERGSIVKFHTPNPDEDPDQLYVVLELRLAEGDPELKDRALVEALNTGLPIPGTSVYLLNDLIEVDDVKNPKTPEDATAVLELLKRLIRLFIQNCDPQVTPEICRISKTKEGYKMIEEAIIKKCKATAMPVGSAMAELDNELQRAYE